MDKCKDILNSFPSVKAWRLGHSSSYNFARHHRFLPLITYSYRIKWTLEKCLESSSQFDSVSDWRRNDRRAYNAASSNGFLDKCIAHMKPKNSNSKINYSYEECRESASKFKSRTEWYACDSSKYLFARRKDWVVDFFPVRKSNSSPYTYEVCLQKAQEFGGGEAWNVACPGSYSQAYKKGFLPKIYEAIGFRSNQDIYKGKYQPECLSKDGCDASKSRRSAKNNSKLKRVSIQQFLANG